MRHPPEQRPKRLGCSYEYDPVGEGHSTGPTLRSKWCSGGFVLGSSTQLQQNQQSTVQLSSHCIVHSIGVTLAPEMMEHCGIPDSQWTSPLESVVLSVGLGCSSYASALFLRASGYHVSSAMDVWLLSSVKTSISQQAMYCFSSGPDGQNATVTGRGRWTSSVTAWPHEVGHSRRLVQ